MPLTFQRWHASVALALFLLAGTAEQTVAAEQGALVQPHQADLRDELAIKRAELKLKQDELKFRQSEAAAQRWSEDIKTYGTVLSVIVALVAVAVPVWGALRNISAQRDIASAQARLNFQMKAAELVLSNVENATQTREKARALADLFAEKSYLPPDFAARFDPKQFRLDYGNSNKRRQQLIELTAQHHERRQQILEDWYVLFWWDWWWIEPLLGNDPARLDELRKMRQRLRANEAKTNAGLERNDDPYDGP